MDLINYLTITLGLVALVVSLNVAIIFGISYWRKRENKFMKNLTVYLVTPVLAFFLVCGNLFIEDPEFHRNISLLIIMIVSLYIIITGIKLTITEWDERYCTPK